MKRAVRLMGRAERDVAEARDWYESQSSGLGVRFVVTILTALSRLRGLRTVRSRQCGWIRPVCH